MIALKKYTHKSENTLMILFNTNDSHKNITHYYHYEDQHFYGY